MCNAMKRYTLLLPLLVCAAALTGCVADGPRPVLTGAPVYPGYYGQGYYNDPPPGSPYGPVYGAGPGPVGEVAVVRTDVYHGRVYNERDYYYRNGRRYPRVYRNGSSPARSAAYTRPARGYTHTQAHAPQPGRVQRGPVVNRSNAQQPNRQPASNQKQQKPQ